MLRSDSGPIPTRVGFLETLMGRWSGEIDLHVFIGALNGNGFLDTCPITRQLFLHGSNFIKL